MFINIVVRILGLNKDYNISIPKSMLLKNACELIRGILLDETYGELQIDKNFDLLKISDGKVLDMSKTLDEQVIDNGEMVLLV